MKETLKKIRDYGTTLESRVEELINRLDKDAGAMEKEMVYLLLQNLFLETADGILTPSKANVLKAASLDKLFDLFAKEFLKGRMSEFAQDLLKMAELAREYFHVVGFAEKQLLTIAKKMEVVELRIGITRTGELLPGGYLDTLLQTPEIRQVVKDYVLTSIISRRPLQEYTRGLGQLIKGSPEVDGLLKRYYRTYAYDSFNQVHEIASQHFAEQLELKHFIYEGSVIKTTRKFCAKRAGKVFTQEETKNWKNDPDLINPATRNTYNPIIERGRYNCRHWIAWISDDLAAQMKKQ
jgi:hypothetical protein